MERETEGRAPTRAERHDIEREARQWARRERRRLRREERVTMRELVEFLRAGGAL